MSHLDEFEVDNLPCPVDGCTDTLGTCLRRADAVWPEDPHSKLFAEEPR